MNVSMAITKIAMAINEAKNISRFQNEFRIKADKNSKKVCVRS